MSTEQYCHCPLAVAAVCIASSIEMDKVLRIVYTGCVSLRCGAAGYRTTPQRNASGENEPLALASDDDTW